MDASGTAPHGAHPTSIAELRAVAQPPEVRGRRNAEHWTASLYLRNLSPYLTWLLLKTSISANGVTGLMILVGWSTAAALLIPGIWGAALALILGQLQMLVDCCDGEVARWRGTSSPAGVFLDKVGHYTTEALIPIVLGIRAAGFPFQAPDDYLWTTLGVTLALIIVLNKALNDMVHVARANAGLAKLADTHGESAPTHGLVSPAATCCTVRAVPPAVPLGRTDDARAARGRSSACSSATSSRTASSSPYWCRWRFSRSSGTSSRSWRRSVSGPELTTFGVVVLTQGKRPDDLRRGLDSVLAQHGVATDIVVRRQRLGPGDRRAAAPDGVATLALDGEPRDPCRPQPRCAVRHGRAPLLPRRRREHPRRRLPDRRHGAPRPRPRDRHDPAADRRPVGTTSPRRWIPRIRKGDADAVERRRSRCGRARSSSRATSSTRAGGWAAPFFYAHEGIDLAWRVWDEGRCAWYAGDLVAAPPGDRADPALRTTTGSTRATASGWRGATCRRSSSRSTSARGRASSSSAGSADHRRLPRGSADGRKAGRRTRASVDRCPGGRSGA